MTDDAKDPEQPGTIEECLETVQQLEDQNQELKQENEELRESADAFGELAERLAITLRKEREAAEKSANVPPNRPRDVE